MLSTRIYLVCDERGESRIIYSSEALELLAQGVPVYEVTTKRVRSIFYHDDLLKEAGFEL